MRHTLPILAFVAFAGLCTTPASAATPTTKCKAVPKGTDIQAAADARIHVRTIGKGKPILLIPSLARGVDDFDDLAQRLAKQGYMSILPDPRGTGLTEASAPSSLFDLAHDAQVVAQTLCDGPVDVVGHAFGNRVARAFATSSPERVRSVVLLAGGGKARPLPVVGNSIENATQQGIVPDDQRLKGIQTAFFAPGHDASVWLNGWYPKAAAYQQQAGKGSSVDQWWSGGNAPILLVQAADDPIAPAANADELSKDIGTRLTLITLRHSSHAILPEQPAAVAWLLAHYFAGERDSAALQKGSDARIRT